ncbi:unnamed protein product [Protopolystoma xenopodis]|uniref:Protein kinase domain-containing protein n=1 Tax=Protopolystoma xenopodis TaxID=117903 RepID=A0A3S4ZFG8_9PLAT|nr:unnamed protein product [Protopolystoma xenopodis]
MNSIEEKIENEDRDKITIIGLQLSTRPAVPMHGPTPGSCQVTIKHRIPNLTSCYSSGISIFGWFGLGIWSVGVLTYFLLTGVSPFLADDKSITMDNITHCRLEFPDDLFSHISPAAIDFIKKLLQKKPGSVTDLLFSYRICPKALLYSATLILMALIFVKMAI